MSRIGKQPIILPSGVSVTINSRDGGTEVAVKGPKGELKQFVRSEVKVTQEEGVLLVTRSSDGRKERSFHGLFRTLIANMVTGVSEGYTRNLQIIGVGYRAAVEGKKLIMQLGYSHPVEIDPPAGIELSVEKNTKVTVSGIDKQVVGEIAAFIRSRRPPEPYKGKGVKYEDEYIRRKAGKAATAK
jgi:large subunit ribosomal protein L6